MKYSFSDYNKYVSLKLSFGIWLVIVYFLRPFILMLTTVQMGRGMKNDSVSLLKDMVYPDNFGLFIGCLAALPVIPVIVAYSKRKPGASDTIKKWWHNGANFLATSAILNIIVLFVPRRMETSHPITIFGWAQLIIAVSIIIFLYKSRRVKDTFADFPRNQ